MAVGGDCDSRVYFSRHSGRRALGDSDDVRNRLVPAVGGAVPGGRHGDQELVGIRAVVVLAEMGGAERLPHACTDEHGPHHHVVSLWSGFLDMGEEVSEVDEG